MATCLTRRCAVKIRILFFLACFLFPLFVSNADMIVKKYNLHTIVSESDIAFRGVCKSREVTTYPPGSPKPLVATYYVFSILERFKGPVEVGKDFSFYQFGASGADAQKAGVPVTRGVARFDLNKEYFLFLNGPTSIGFYAPRGLSQSVFNVKYAPDGTASVENPMSNENLFQGLPKSMSVSKAIKAGNVDPATFQKGAIPLDDFRNMVNMLK